MLHRVLVVSMLVLLIGGVRSGLAFDAGEPGEPMDQYQMNFKRQNLGTALGIDQTKVERLLQIDQKYKSQKRQAIHDAKAAFQQLQQVMGQSNPPENEVAVILDNIMRLRKQKLTLEQQQLQEEKSILTPVQQARYIILLMNMRHQIAREAQRVRNTPQGVPVPPKPTGPREVPAVSRPGTGY
jgi:myosin heavy subunit